MALLELNPPLKYVNLRRVRNEYCCILKGPHYSKKIIIPIIDNKPPSSGLFLGAHLLPNDIQIGSALSVGCGENLPAELCGVALFQISHIDCTELDQKAILRARKIILQNGLSKRISIKKCNLFPKSRLKYNLIFSDISQMPLPPGVAPNYHDYGGYDGWELINRIISQSGSHLMGGGYFSLFIFGFLGVESRTNSNIPSLRERLQSNNFRIIKRSKYRRKIRFGGVTHQSLEYIQKMYPLAKFFSKAGKVISRPSSYISAKKSLYFDTFIINAVYLGR